MTDLLHTISDFPTKLYTHLIPSLEKNLITTTDLLTLEPLEIARRAQLPLLDVKRLTKHVLASLQCQLGLANAEETLREYEDASNTHSTSSLNQPVSAVADRWSIISTLDPTLDAALSGGIPTGYITEITGESGAGKTQFLLLLLLTTQLPATLGGLSRPTVYISTEHPLPTSRLSQILLTHPSLSSLPHQDKPSLSQVFSIQTPDLESQDHILTYQIPVLLSRHNIGLIVIDSITANYRAERSANATSGAALGLRSTQLMKLGHHLRTLAREHNCAIVVSNQVADRFSPTSPLPTTICHPTGSSPPHSSLSSPSSPQHASSSTTSSQTPQMQSLDAAIMPPPPPAAASTTTTSHPHHHHPQRPPIYPPLTLDHQQNFFTGWSAPPPYLSSPAQHDNDNDNNTNNQNLKTPALGLVWTNQLACRIALHKQRTSLTIEGKDQGDAGGSGRGQSPWTRYLKIVFASWGPSTRIMDRGIGFEIWAGGIRALGTDHVAQEHS